MRRKALRIVLSAAMIMTLVTGCGSKGDSEKAERATNPFSIGGDTETIASNEGETSDDIGNPIDDNTAEDNLFLQYSTSCTSTFRSITVIVQ